MKVKPNKVKSTSRKHHPESRIQEPASSIQHPVPGNRPFIIPIFLPHAGCPHQCIFCNQDSITGKKEKSISARQLQSRVEMFLKYNYKHRRPVQIAFFGGNFLGQKTDVVEMLLKEATKSVVRGEADSIRFSTRPDTIDRPRLELIRNFPVSTVELGVQSMDPEILKTSRRGHTDLDTERAVDLLKDCQYDIGVQLMIGLPGDAPDKMMKTGQRVADLKPDFVRIYPTLVVQGSPLAKWYQEGKYRPLSLETAVTRVKDLYLLLNKAGIPVIRMGLQHEEGFDDPETILAGPYHPAFGHLVYSEIFFDRVKMTMASDSVKGKTLQISVNPRNVSRMKGLNNENIIKLNALFRLESVEVISDPSISENKLKVNGCLISVAEQDGH
jgi:histone acetyltransferase (RNA polymerase elongator complex component)